jgi:hypothetical protein
LVRKLSSPQQRFAGIVPFVFTSYSPQRAPLNSAGFAGMGEGTAESIFKSRHMRKRACEYALANKGYAAKKPKGRAIWHPDRPGPAMTAISLMGMMVALAALMAGPDVWRLS